MENKKLENLTLEDINKHIVYAPNSSGKTRLSTKLFNENADVLLFTSSSIGDLLDISGKTINIGPEAKLVSQNSEIEKEINKTDFASLIKEIYNVKSAKDLCSKSFIFSWADVKKVQSFDLINALSKFTKNFNTINGTRNFEIGSFIDKNLSLELFKNVANVFETSVSSDLEFDNNYISKNVFEKLSYIFKIIGDETECPLCGYDWKENKLLKQKVKNKLSKYKILENVDNKSTILELYNFFVFCNDNFNSTIFNVSKKSVRNIYSLKENFQQLLAFLMSYADELTKKYIYSDDLFKVSEHNKNLKEIEKIKNERVKTNSFDNDVLNIVDKIIVLPDGYHFVANNGSIKIVNQKNNSIDPSKFLSESEKRRLCIAILFAETRSRNIRFLLLDDPADSNDDYYFDNLINLIIDFLNESNNFGWSLLTHEVRVPYLFSKEEERLQLKGERVDYKYTFYLPDPSDSSGKKPPLSRFDVTFNEVNVINEHEVILFKKIFKNLPGYEVDPELALLSSFNQCRGLYNELLKNHKIKNKESKLLSKKIKKVTSTYEHYVFDHSRSARVHDLFLMNKMAYVDGHINSRYDIKKSSYAYNFREKFLKKKYSLILCTNPLIKYILYTILRVLNCHFNFERKLAEWANNNIPSFNKGGFETTFCIWPKLNNVDGYMAGCSIGVQNDFDKYKRLFSKSRKLLNDFSHSASMMFPPFLSVNPLDISRLENEIKKLPK